MKLYNTLTRQLDTIEPLNPPKVTVYTCGPTVYDYAHIGHWFNYVRMDTLIRTLKLSGFQTEWVMNITDVGHLVSDADEGEDKLEKGAKREGKTAWEVAEYYTKDFLDGMQLLGITTPNHITKATEHIPEQIELIKTLESKGYTYTISDGVYYDTSKFEGYAAFARLDLEGMQAGARVDYNREKRNPTDFALWKFSPTDHKRDMEWWSPWVRPGSSDDEQHPIGISRATVSGEMQGADEHQTESYDAYDEGGAENATQQVTAQRGSWGFPGWHIECSAMAMKYLGATLDIHAGGIDHIPVHHTNEIAQSEAATGKRFANYWMHSNHVTVDGDKISKSLGNGIRLQEILDKGVTAEAVRLHILESSYRSQSKFSLEALESAQNRLRNLQAMAVRRWQPTPDASPALSGQIDATRNAIREALENDLDTPHALAILSNLETTIDVHGVSSDTQGAFAEFLEWLDSALGLGLARHSDITEDQKQSIADRQQARASKDWATSDELRDKLLSQGISVRDTEHGPIWSRLA